MIDLGVEFKRMAEQFDIPDKEVLASVRTMIRLILHSQYL